MRRLSWDFVRGAALAALLAAAPPPARAGLLVANSTPGAPAGSDVLAYDALTGAPLGAFVPAGSGGLNVPQGLTFGPDGNLYVTSSLDASVFRYDAAGNPLGAFVPAESGGLQGANRPRVWPGRQPLRQQPDERGAALRRIERRVPRGLRGRGQRRVDDPRVPGVWLRRQPLCQLPPDERSAALRRDVGGVPGRLCRRGQRRAGRAG